MKNLHLIFVIAAIPVLAFALAPGQPTAAQVAVYHREHGVTNAAYALGVNGHWSGNVPPLSACRPASEAASLQAAWLASRAATAVSTNSTR